MKKRVRKSITGKSTSRKRRKSQFSTRYPQPDEREHLAATFERFIEAGKDSWPVDEVVNHRRGPRNTLRYLVKWVDHPETGEVYKPTWVSGDGVTTDLVEAYWAGKNARSREIAESREGSESREHAESETIVGSNNEVRRSPRQTTSPAGKQLENRTPRQTSAPCSLADSSSEPQSQWGQARIVTRSLSNTEASISPSSRSDQSKVAVDTITLAQRGHCSEASSDRSLEPSPPPGSTPEPQLEEREFEFEPGPVSISETDLELDPKPTPGPESGSESERESPPDLGSEPDPKPTPVPDSGSESERASPPDLGSETDPESVIALEQEGELETSSRPESEFSTPPDPISEPERESTRSPSRSHSNQATEFHAPISQHSSRRPSYSLITPTPPLEGLQQERQRGPALDSTRPRRLPARQTEEPHAPTSAASPSRRRQYRASSEPPAADNAFAEESSVNFAGSSSTLVPGSSEFHSPGFLPQERSPSTEKSRRFFNPTYRPTFVAAALLAARSRFDLSSFSYLMDPSVDPIVGLPGMQPLEPGSVPSGAAEMSFFDVSALPIQNSIEEEEQTSNGEQFSSDSKASSSQQSVENERDVPQVAGLVPPSLPILGPAEYALALPCEGKIQSIYSDIIKDKEKSIKKFLSRHESVGSSNGSPARTQERNEMNELVQRLHDTVTHMDLGLPGIPTQYPDESQEHAAYANYAGSKFSFLGHLVELFKNIGCSIIIMAREGPIQDLLEGYLKMKHVAVKRQDRMARSKSATPDRIITDFQVELLSTGSTHQVAIYSRPILMIAFDSSFDSQDPQVARIRSHFSEKRPSLLPVLHLLVANSSEHVERCLPRSMPSTVKLKALVRATYQAWPNLGGKPTYLPRPTDQPEGRPMDVSDLQRGIRKSPERKLAKLASIVLQAAISPDFDKNWSLSLMPELQLTEYAETPAKRSGVTTRAETPREALARSRTPLSRSGTPSGKKRLLDVDGFLPALQKRQRLTPLRDSAEASNKIDTTYQVAQLQDQIKKLEAELGMERVGRQNAEQDRENAHEQLAQWKQDHAGLQRRYEKRMTKCHELERQNKNILKTIESNKTRNEKFAEDNLALKQKNAELQKELAAARAEIKAGGGDAAAVEAAREEARTLLAKNTALERSLENTRKDFEFTRTQYQEASNKAAEFANQVTDLEGDVAKLSQQAGTEKRRLKETNYQNSIKQHLAKIAEMELERKSRDTLLRKLEEENRHLRRNRGIQTRGSSVQPPGSPGLDGHSGRGTRSRQGSPAPGLFANSHHNSVASRGSLLRHER
ncbi:uncharacterized protein Z520_05003 [Fonsecaea multimorphosa CBS 102226]|uniref:Chromo domain-containing protein n=1 Tax=Fonsecaea multimorphosa CBS 102226 TaxID=1442371 RepID=A0A0D2K0Y1_9EURO|nr:uncharacterized protein Z520_05003 [Fonsecaea multimorphosa CBS 102226]KIX99427.1 hypothetical protein Z520_05003 [Fonsecaea multimorphosa CBS 102226]